MELIPANVKSSAQPANGVIQNFMTQQVPKLESSGTTQKLARDQILADAESKVTTPSPQYLTMYADDLNAALLPLTAKGAAIRTRINAGVVAADVARMVVGKDGSAAGLAPVVQALLSDPQPAMALWGIKASKYVMASQVVTGGNPSTIAKLVVNAVKNNPDSGPIVEEAFSALTFENVPNRNAPQFVGGLGPMIPDLLDLIQWRGDQYKAGASVPSPLADRAANSFLPVTAFTAVSANPATLNRTLKVLGETTCATIHAIQNGNSSPDLIDLVKSDGQAFVALGNAISNDAVKKAGDNIDKLSQATDQGRMGAMCTELATALKSVGVDIASGGPGADAAPAPAVAGGSK